MCQSSPPNPGQRTCPRCGAVFVCGTEAGHARCWCADLPPVMLDAKVSGCLCPVCLKAMIARQPGPA